MSSTVPDVSAYPPASEIVQEVKKKLSHRDEVELKKQLLREQEEAECTFKPKLTPFKTTKVNASVESPNPTDVNQQSKQLDEKKKSKQSPVPVALLQKHENAKRKEVEPDKNSPAHMPPKVTAESINRLYNGIGSGHTKAPAIVESEEVKTKKMPSVDINLTAQRLYSEADKLKAKTEQMRLEVESSITSQCTFKPQINKTRPKEKLSSKDENQAVADAAEPSPSLVAVESNLVALTQRMEKFALEKARKLEEARKAREDEELKDCSFSPALIKRTTANAQKRSGTPTRERAAGGNNIEKTPTTVFRRMVPTPDQPSFKPQLVTNYVISNRANADGTNVHDRLFQTGVASRKEQEALRKQQQDAEIDKVCTFSPAMHSKKLSNGESTPSKDLFNRLANEKKEDMAPVKELMELNNCTFHPQISDMAHGIRHSFGGPIHERLNAEAEAKANEAKKREEKRLEEELKGATFSPEIPNSSTQILVRKQTAALMMERKQTLDRQSISNNTTNLDDIAEMIEEPVKVSTTISPKKAAKGKAKSPESQPKALSPKNSLTGADSNVSPVAAAAKKLLSVIAEEEGGLNTAE